jgi:hypothetical protein
MDGRPPQPVASLAGSKVTRPAISIDRKHAAWLSAQRDKVLTGDLAGASPVRVILQARPGATFTQPSWDHYGNLWTVESSDNQSWLWVQQPGGKPIQSGSWEMSVYRVLAFRVALDGVRVAAIVFNGGKGEIWIGRIVHDQNDPPAAGSFLQISTSVSDAADLTWRGADDLVVLGKAEGVQPAPYDVPVSGDMGYAIGTGTPAGLSTIAAGPSPIPVLTGVHAQDGDHAQGGDPSLCWLKDSHGDSSDWTCEEPGAADPVYPG